MRLRRTKTLRVYPNPWGVNPFAVINGTPVDTAVFDHEGRPCGVMYADTLAEGGASHRLVGAQVCNSHTSVDGSAKRPAVVVGNIWRPRQRTVYSYLGHTAQELKPFELAEKLAKAEPVTVLYGEYYRQAVFDGSLIAADESSAKECGVKFEAPAALFPKLAKAFAQVFDAQYEDPGSYEFFISERSGGAIAPPEPPLPSTEPATPSAKRKAADATTKETT